MGIAAQKTILALTEDGSRRLHEALASTEEVVPGGMMVKVSRYFDDDGRLAAGDAILQLAFKTWLPEEALTCIQVLNPIYHTDFGVTLSLKCLLGGAGVDQKSDTWSINLDDVDWQTLRYLPIEIWGRLDLSSEIDLFLQGCNLTLSAETTTLRHRFLKRSCLPEEADFEMLKGIDGVSLDKICGNGRLEYEFRIVDENPEEALGFWMNFLQVHGITAELQQFGKAERLLRRMQEEHTLS